MASKKIILGMSGGVDSAVAAGLLKDDGWDPTGVYLIMEDPESDPRLQEHIQDARTAAEKAGVAFRTWDVSERFTQTVVEPFVRAYMSGRTPNPCVLCNPELKFNALMDVANKNGANRVATGHYVRVKYNENYGRRMILRGKDPKKEQSYFLGRLTRKQIDAFVAPLGIYAKDEIEALARERGLAPLADKPSSQEICFIAGHYMDFLMERPEIRAQIKAGPIMNREGKTLGKHKGLPFYTIGQRGGLGVAWEHPLYVIEIDREKNRLIVGGKDETYAKGLIAGDQVWAIEPPEEPFRARVQIRYRHRAARARIAPSEKGKRLRIEFDAPQLAVTPGQAAVVYENEAVLCSGVIESQL